MENGREFSAMIAAAMQNSEQLMQINKMLGKANFELNRKENLACNIARVSEVECWVNLLTVPGFEIYSDYEVSTFGNIRKHPIGKDFKNMKLTKDKNGYLRVGLTANGKRKKFSLNRIVAAAFCENDNPEVKTQVNHCSHTDKTDNFYRNLEWVSPKENTQAYWQYDEEVIADRKRKMSEAMKGKHDGENNPNFGKKHSEESRKKMAIAAKAAHARKREEKANLAS